MIVLRASATRLSGGSIARSRSARFRLIFLEQYDLGGADADRDG
jgi:hypothetical protein